MLNQTKQTLVQGLVKSKGPAKANKILEGLKEAAAAEGLPIHFNGPVGSTGMAHTLVAVAAEFGKSEEMIDRLFHAFFVEQRDITSYAALYPIFDEFDFDRKWLKEQEYGLKLKPVVKNLIEENSNIGITGTPFVIFNKTFGLAGAHPVDKLMFIMDALLNNEQPSELTSVMFQPTPTEE
ncbi:hypothetical protein H4R35_007149 [Dimargaris xerosporica]|nr:hypothetical protein H4R35_007149 [Dimargaris xerosporica]